MFWPDVLEYKNFYSSPCGAVVMVILKKLLRRLWPEASQKTITGLGYAIPVLQDIQQNQRSFAFMPSQQGVIHWPSSQANRSILTDDAELPLADHSIDRLIMLHMLEHSIAPEQLLQEAWRVLEPGGKLLIIVPNRRSIWAMLDSTPFGHGRPFSRGQLRKIMEESRFTPINCGRMLFFPPSNSRIITRYATIIEKIISIMCLPLGGLLWMEAEKQVYAVRKAEAKSRKLKPVAIPAMEGVLRSE